MNSISFSRVTGYLAIGSSCLMLLGAICFGASGTDLWAALAQDDVAGYLAAVPAAETLLRLNLSLWIPGVMLVGISGAMLSRLCRQQPTLAYLALSAYRIATPVVVVAYIAMASLVVVGAHSDAEGMVAAAELVGWLGVRADDLATILILGVGPVLISLAARHEWMPNWLFWWGMFCGVAGVVALLGIYLPQYLAMSYPIIPAGMFWTIFAGVSVLRKKPEPASL